MGFSPAPGDSIHTISLSIPVYSKIAKYSEQDQRVSNKHMENAITQSA